MPSTAPGANNAPTLPQLALVDLMNKLVDKLMMATPTQGPNGKPGAPGYVYAQLPMGQPVDPADFANPWTPNLSSTAAVADQTAAPAAGTAAPTGPTPAQQALANQLNAAYQTSMLFDQFLRVTEHGEYLVYPDDAKISVLYNMILTGAQTVPGPAPDPAIVAQVLAAQKVLYVFNPDPNNPGNLINSFMPTQLYQNYQTNQVAYAAAQANYAAQRAQAMANPATAGLWPEMAAPYQVAVTQAFNTWRNAGATQVESALDTIQSQGQNMVQAVIANAKANFSNWNLSLSGVPGVNSPYTYVEPSEWADPTVDNIGWTSLTVTRSSSQTTGYAVSSAAQNMWWNNSSSSVSQQASGGFMGIGAQESSSNANQNAANAASAGTKSVSLDTMQVSDLTISLEYMQIRIMRPWLDPTLFDLANWYIVQEPAQCVSDGQIPTQTGISPGPSTRLLPMIPESALVIRNVKITSSNWGKTAATLATTFSANQGASSASQNSAGGGTNVNLGFINFGGGATVKNSSAAGAAAGSSSTSAQSLQTGYFDGSTLGVNGTQIVAFFSTITPSSPALADPTLPKPKAQSSGASSPAAQAVPSGAGIPGTPPTN